MNKLTVELCAKYFGAKVRLPNGKISKIISMHENGNIQVSHSTGSQDIWNVSNCRLILKPLDKISDEDAIDVAKMLFDNKSLHKSILFDNEIVLGLKYWTKIIGYLSSKSYDCDNLLTTGEAIEM